ncbi:MAG: hypothetical protein ACTS6P_00670 [Candidatus Hodgkinia cicadicola]
MHPPDLRFNDNKRPPYQTSHEVPQHPPRSNTTTRNHTLAPNLKPTPPTVKQTTPSWASTTSAMPSIGEQPTSVNPRTVAENVKQPPKSANQSCPNGSTLRLPQQPQPISQMSAELTIAKSTNEPVDVFWGLAPSTKFLANAYVSACGLNIFRKCTFVDGAVPLMSAVLKRGGLIFSDERRLSSQLESPALKHRAVCITDILRLRSKVAYGPRNDVLAKIAALLDPKSCALSLGTWPQLASKALSAMCSNELPATMTILCPLLPVPPTDWWFWFKMISSSSGSIFWAIQTAFGGTDLIRITFDAIAEWGLHPTAR